jgi:hypothetical protein
MVPHPEVRLIARHSVLSLSRSAFPSRGVLFPLPPALRERVDRCRRFSAGAGRVRGDSVRPARPYPRLPAPLAGKAPAPSRQAHSGPATVLCQGVLNRRLLQRLSAIGWAGSERLHPTRLPVAAQNNRNPRPSRQYSAGAGISYLAADRAASATRLAPPRFGCGALRERAGAGCA